MDEAIRHRDANEYDLIAHTIMPNHVHLVVTNVRWQDKIISVSPVDSGEDKSMMIGSPEFSGLSVGQSVRPTGRSGDPTDIAETGAHRAAYFNYPLSNVLRKLKWNTALRANKVLGRSGTFWHPESYDHVIRDGRELERTIWYVLMNPVKAGLCADRHDWEWSYVKNEYING